MGRAESLWLRQWMDGQRGSISLAAIGIIFWKNICIVNSEAFRSLLIVFSTQALATFLCPSSWLMPPRQNEHFRDDIKKDIESSTGNQGQRQCFFYASRRASDSELQYDDTAGDWWCVCVCLSDLTKAGRSPFCCTRKSSEMANKWNWITSIKVSHRKQQQHSSQEFNRMWCENSPRSNTGQYRLSRLTGQQLGFR